MDSGQFDRLTKTFARRESRRGALKAVAGATFGALMLSRGGADAAAGEVTIAHVACKERTRRCRRKSRCCGGKTACRQVQDARCGLSGRRCRGKEGAKCRNSGNSCDCCAGLICSEATQRCISAVS